MICTKVVAMYRGGFNIIGFRLVVEFHWELAAGLPSLISFQNPIERGNFKILQTLQY